FAFKLRQRDRAEDDQEEEQVEGRGHRQGDSDHHPLIAPPLLVGHALGLARLFEQARVISKLQPARFAEFRSLLGLCPALGAIHFGNPSFSKMPWIILSTFSLPAPGRPRPANRAARL